MRMPKYQAILLAAVIVAVAGSRCESAAPQSVFALLVCAAVCARYAQLTRAGAPVQAAAGFCRGASREIYLLLFTTAAAHQMLGAHGQAKAASGAGYLLSGAAALLLIRLLARRLNTSVISAARQRPAPAALAS